MSEQLIENRPTKPAQTVFIMRAESANVPGVYVAVFGNQAGVDKKASELVNVFIAEVAHQRQYRGDEWEEAGIVTATPENWRQALQAVRIFEGHLPTDDGGDPYIEIDQTDVIV